MLKFPRFSSRKEEMKKEWQQGLTAALLLLAAGVALGYIQPPARNIPEPYARLSAIIGWVYFLCWSISFYPQVISNYQRQSVIGLSFDFEVYNLLGFTCYSIFNLGFYFNTYVQQEYKRLHHGNANAVQVNDVFFAIHAVIITAFTLFQCFFLYERGTQRVSSLCLKITTISVAAMTIFYIIALCRDHVVASNSPGIFTLLNFLYVVSYVKLGISVVKYVPQVLLNYRRKSTTGWSIWNVLLDFTGGMLSVVQLLLDGFATNDWSAVSGDPVKFGLGFASMFFDVIFMMQHYVWYRRHRDISSSQLPTRLEVQRPLLPSRK